MKYLGVDLATRLTKPVADCLKLNGNAFAIRYLDDSWGQSWKSITESEANVILTAGLSLLLVFETCGGADAPGCATSGAAYFTRDQGIYDAQHAVSQARNVGYPNGLPIFFAVDFDASLVDLENMVEYFNGIYDILNGSAGTNAAYVIGIYGSYRVCSYAKDNWPGIKFYWQTYAWSGGIWMPEAHIKQILNGQSICGVTVDNDESTILGWSAVNMSDYITRAEFETVKADHANSIIALTASVNDHANSIVALTTLANGLAVKVASILAWIGLGPK